MYKAYVWYWGILGMCILCTEHICAANIDFNMYLCRRHHTHMIRLETCIHPVSDLWIIRRHPWFDPSPPWYHWYQQKMFLNNMFYGTIVFHLMLCDSRITKSHLTMITISSINFIGLRHQTNMCVPTGLYHNAKYTSTKPGPSKHWYIHKSHWNYVDILIFYPCFSFLWPWSSSSSSVVTFTIYPITLLDM